MHDIFHHCKYMQLIHMRGHKLAVENKKLYTLQQIKSYIDIIVLLIYIDIVIVIENLSMTINLPHSGLNDNF